MHDTQIRRLPERHDFVTLAAQQIHQYPALGLVQAAAQRVDRGPAPALARRRIMYRCAFGHGFYTVFSLVLIAHSVKRRTPYPVACFGSR